MTENIDITSSFSIADWVELYVLYYDESISKSKIGNLTEASEEVVEGAINELISRCSMYGDKSPFKISGRNIVRNYRWEENPEILMCLVFALQGVYQKKGIDDGTKLFERISCEAVREYLNGEAEVIGFPSASGLIAQIESLSKRTSESLGSRKPLPKDKDKGVDILAWKSHGDGRNNQIILLIQAAAGKHFMKKKSISICAWKEFIESSANFIQGIAIPGIPSYPDDWREVRDDYNLIFDRIRICRSLKGKKLVDKNLRGEIKVWCKERLK